MQLRSLTLALTLTAVAGNLLAQSSRINQKIDSNQRLTISGHIHPKALSDYDLGRVSPSVPVSYVTLALAPTATQQASLEQLLRDQQDPASPEYQHWLTPEQYGERFGASDADITTLTAWLQSQGLSIAAVARGKNWIAVSGSAAQMEGAFQTEFHHFLVDGEMHFANATDPSVPAAFGPVVRGFRGLNDFRMKPKARPGPQLKPDFTSATSGNHYLAPDDIATIYNINPLLSKGFTGAGQKLVVVGQTQVKLSDIQSFRTKYGLSANDPQPMLVPNSQDPGVSNGDLIEADLDLEWTGAVARDATILYVYSFDVGTAWQYTIDQNLAPVMSSSYGLCEQEQGQAATLALRSLAQQGSAQGITWINASGDSGAADCNDSQNSGLAVDTPASIPEVTAVGGTEFSDASGQYWSGTNSDTLASALSYIPEVVWNDTSQFNTPSAGGGGASLFFPKPFWQTGPGVPADNARDVPDISLTASNGHVAYLVYSAGSLQLVGGTSAPTPVFAGLTTLLNQYLGTKALGNLNPKLYSLAQSSAGVFHDITTGNNTVTVTCGRRAINCSATAVGYNAGIGYDQASGLGSIDAYNLALALGGGVTVAPPPAQSISLISSLNPVGFTDTLYLIATVVDPTGITPAGAVSFTIGGNSLGSANLVGSAGTATATLPVTGSQVSQGSGVVVAAFAGVSSSVTVSVQSSSRSAGTVPSINGLGNGASFTPTYSPGMILTVFGSQLSSSIQAAGSVPLPLSMSGLAATINGVIAPLYYVSPGQLNLQIPYETPVNSNALLSINNNGKIITKTFGIASTTPGIFVNQNKAPIPDVSAIRGQTISLFITGAGALTPQLPTGAAPSAQTVLANLPRPAQNVTVTVGGANAPIAFIGDTPGLVGVVQINYQVPGSIATGSQAVVVTIGGVNSQPASLAVTK